MQLCLVREACQGLCCQVPGSTRRMSRPKWASAPRTALAPSLRVLKLRWREGGRRAWARGPRCTQPGRPVSTVDLCQGHGSRTQQPGLREAFVFSVPTTWSSFNACSGLSLTPPGCDGRAWALTTPTVQRNPDNDLMQEGPTCKAPPQLGKGCLCTSACSPGTPHS